ncbi:hypothetical protein [uncultured Bosea sp.]|uniref:hypothetical protein n=1 Tax=uncultured Bosea sp. TaxID=211457 RepID=UPI00263BA5CB|nr:hypothetical protein [uncultured Bosea sp.]
MIAIFTILGVLLFGGGAYAILDGWPYLVLERGFTQVIIGSIASGAGLIMLSLAWVLREVRATRRALTEALGLRSEVQVPAAAVAEPPPVMPSRPDLPSFPGSAAPAVLGAVVGAAAAGAVAHALTASEGESSQASAEEPHASGDRDLFGALVTQHLDKPEPAAEDKPEEAQEHEPSSPEEAEPLPDMFDEALSAAPSFDDNKSSVELEAEGDKPAELVAAKVQDAEREWTFPRHDEPAHPGEWAAEEPPATPDETVEAPAAAADEPELDEFSALRASLAGHLNEPERETGRIEPSFSQEPDPFAAAESWMDRASPRVEPWLDTPPVAEPEPAAETALHWPPRTEAHAFDEPAEPASDDVETASVPEAVEPVHHDEGMGASSGEPEQAAAHVEASEAQAEEAPAAPEARPASDEGIVGAYQVGDAHFTIYADGSIRARTPDGEYSFASMDELKVYLASEKSRLGG